MILSPVIYHSNGRQNKIILGDFRMNLKTNDGLHMPKLIIVAMNGYLNLSEQTWRRVIMTSQGALTLNLPTC